MFNPVEEALYTALYDVLSSSHVKTDKSSGWANERLCSCGAVYHTMIAGKSWEAHVARMQAQLLVDLGMLKEHSDS